MARSKHRHRHQVSARRVRALRLLGFRYSPSRDAYVLRAIGNRFGPVYQVRDSPPPHADGGTPPPG